MMIYRWVASMACGHEKRAFPGIAGAGPTGAGGVR